MIPLDIVDDGYQLRLSMNQKDIHSLSESITANGMMQPVGVHSTKNGRYKTIFGHRRLAAARLAGLEEIPIVIIESENPELLALLENLQRKNLNAREEALGIWTLIKAKKYKQVDLSRMLNKSESHISKIVKVGKLVEKLGHKLGFTKLSLNIYMELADTSELIGLAEVERWNQGKARYKAKKAKSISEMVSGDSRVCSRVSNVKNQSYLKDIESYEPIILFDGGFEIRPFKFKRNSRMNISVMIEKLEELTLGVEHAIATMKQSESNSMDGMNNF